MMRLVMIFVLAAIAASRIAGATIYAPADDAELSAASAAIVTGTVVASSPRKIGGRIVTETTVAVDHTYKGAVAGMDVTVTTPGGQVGDESVVVYGAPSFVTGETVLLYLQSSAGGEVRTTGLALGAYGLTTAVDGTVIASQMVPTRQARRLDDIAGTAQALGDLGSVVGAPSTTGGDGTPVTANFTLLGSTPGRWFQPDDGQPVRLAMANADTDLGVGASNAVVDAAMAAWTDVPTATIELDRGGSADVGPSIASGECDGRSVVQFNDPLNEIGALHNCTGVLAVGGFCTKGASGTVNGQRFSRISEGDLTVADGLGNCLGLRGFEEIVTHEIGHVIGLGHSSENANEPNPELKDATMYFLAHLDGRGASLKDDDIAGVSFIYPVSGDPNDLDGDGVPNADDDCPDTPALEHVDTNGCACGEDGHVPCDDGLVCTLDQCDAVTGKCAAAAIDCTGGDPCLTGSCDATTGCAIMPLTGDAGILCVYQRPFPPTACLGERVPRVVRKLLRTAARLATQGVEQADARSLARADRKLARARKVIERVANRRKRPQGPVCASALVRLVDDARGRLPRFRSIDRRPSD